VDEAAGRDAADGREPRPPAPSEDVAHHEQGVAPGVTASRVATSRKAQSCESMAATIVASPAVLL